MANDPIATLKIGGRTLKENEFVAAVENTINANVVSGLSEVAIKLIDELEKNAPVGGTRNLSSGITLLGVTENADKTGYRIEILFASEYHDYIDKGVEGVKVKGKVLPNSEGRTYKFKNYGMPDEAIKNLQKWARGKNIENDAKAKIEESESEGKKKTKVKKYSEEESAARRLAYMIKRHGIKPRNFKAKSVQAISKDMNKTLRKVTGNSFILKIAK